MQTFLPDPDFARSAALLDRARLGKQRLEAYQILRTLRGESAGWSNHPAVKMWRGHEGALVDYGLAMCAEWVARGYKDTLTERLLAMREDYADFTAPAWTRDAALHRSHQSNLVRKDPGFYSPAFPGVPAGLPYVWPGKGEGPGSEEPGPASSD